MTEKRTEEYTMQKNENMMKDDELKDVSGGRLVEGWEKILLMNAYNCFRNGRSFEDFKNSFDKGTYTRSIAGKAGLDEDDQKLIAELMEDIKKIWK